MMENFAGLPLYAKIGTHEIHVCNVSQPVPKRRSRSPVAKPTPARGIEWKIHFALAALVLIAWSNSFGLGFARDGGAVTSDVRIQAASAENVDLILSKDYWWPNPADRLYRPVTTLSYLLKSTHMYFVVVKRNAPTRIGHVLMV
jgi:hypothetical protein